MYFFYSCWWRAEPKRGNSKLTAISLSSNLLAIFFLKTTSSSSIFGLIYLSSSVGQKPQNALQMIFPYFDFSSRPKISLRSFSKMSCLYKSCYFSFSRFFMFCLSKFFFWNGLRFAFWHLVTYETVELEIVEIAYELLLINFVTYCYSVNRFFCLSVDLIKIKKLFFTNSVENVADRVKYY